MFPDCFIGKAVYRKEALFAAMSTDRHRQFAHRTAARSHARDIFIRRWCGAL